MGGLLLAVNKIIVVVVCFLLIGCERYLGLESSEIIDWANDNSELLREFANKSTQVHASGELDSLDDFINLRANFSSKAEEDSFERVVAEIFKKLNYSDEKININLEFNNKYQSIYITLYQSGFCASLGNCLATFLVYYPEPATLIIEKCYSYTSTSVKGWYLLKVSNC